jgi:hypothetical protein
VSPAANERDRADRLPSLIAKETPMDGPQHYREAERIMTEMTFTECARDSRARRGDRARPEPGLERRRGHQAVGRLLAPV